MAEIHAPPYMDCVHYTILTSNSPLRVHRYSICGGHSVLIGFAHAHGGMLLGDVTAVQGFCEDVSSCILRLFSY